MSQIHQDNLPGKEPTPSSRGCLFPRIRPFLTNHPLGASLVLFAFIFICLLGAALLLRSPEWRGTMDLQLLLPEKPGKFAEPILVSGKEKSGDSIAVRQISANQIAIIYDHWDSPRIQSETFAIEPGKPTSWRIQFSKLDYASYVPQEKTHLTITVDGKIRLDRDVPVFTRKPKSLYIAKNPLGGQIAPVFSGKVLSITGPESRIKNLLKNEPYVLLGLVFFSFVITLIARKLLLITPETFAFYRPFTLRNHAGFLAAFLISIVVGGWMITWGSWQFLQREDFGNFYEYQAASLLNGQWDVCIEAISGEAFVYKEKLYGYFGPTPALERMPFVLFDIYVGKLSRFFCLLWFGVFQITAYVLLLRFQAVFLGHRRDNSIGWQLLCFGFVLSAGLGSTLIFLLSRSFTYHEALLTGGAFCLLAWSLALANYPRVRTLLYAWFFALLSIQCKPTVGMLAFCGVGAACLWGALRCNRWFDQKFPGGPVPAPGSWYKFILLGLCCVLGIFSFNLVSYAKFENFEGAPLRYNVQFDAARLARFEGKNFSLVNIPFNLRNYFLQNSLDFSPAFPFVELEMPVSDKGRGVRMDSIERFSSIPSTHISLIFVALIGAVFLWRHSASTRLVLAFSILAFLPMLLFLTAANAISQRYTADFLSFFILMAAAGILAINRCSSPALRRSAIALFLVLTLPSVIINPAISLHYQRAVTWGVPMELREEYYRWKQRFTFSR